jgi:hypothetical protein
MQYITLYSQRQNAKMRRNEETPLHQNSPVITAHKTILLIVMQLKEKMQTSPAPSSIERKVALITGVAGQDGSYLAELLLEKGYAVRFIHCFCFTKSYPLLNHTLTAPPT